MADGSSKRPFASLLVNAPRPSQVFVGRVDDLRALEEMLFDSAVCGAVAVEGQPGVGKTELALQATYRFAERGLFPGGIFWLDAEDPNLSRSWAALADEHPGIQSSLGMRAAQVIEHLEQSGESTLLVLDNVECWANARPVPLPTGAHINLLATTRRRYLGGPQFAHFELGVLVPPYDGELLRRAAGRTNLGDTSALLKELEGHALALQCAGTFLRVFPAESVPSYLAKWQANARMDESVVGDLGRYGATAMQAYELLWAALGERGAANVTDSWCLASLFAAERVSKELSERCGLGSAEQRTLRDHFLIEHDDEGGWRMHRLIRDFGRRKHRAGKSAISVASRFLDGAVEWAADLENRWPMADMPHFLEALKLGEASGWKHVDAFRASLATELAIAGDRHDRVLAGTLYQRQIAALVEKHGENDRVVAHCRLDLVELLRRLAGDSNLVKAQKLAEKVLAGNTAANHRGRSLLAEVLKDRGDKESLEKAKAILESLQVSERGISTGSLMVLADVLKALGGNENLEKAKTLLETMLEEKRQRRGDWIFLGGVEQRLVDVLRELGGESDLSRAEELDEELTHELNRHMEKFREYRLRKLIDILAEIEAAILQDGKDVQKNHRLSEAIGRARAAAVPEEVIGRFIEVVTVGDAAK